VKVDVVLQNNDTSLMACHDIW